MEQDTNKKQNSELIKDGLPLSSDDFINAEKVKTKKSNLLVALDKINRVHEEKMSPPKEQTPTVEDTGYNPDIYSITKAEPTDEYILSNQIEKTEEFATQPMQEADLGMNNTAPNYTVDNPSGYNFQPSSEEYVAEYPQNSDYSYSPGTEQNPEMGQPMYVVDDSQIGVKSKKSKKTSSKSSSKTTYSSPEEIRSGKKYAWLAYIIFFIPLLINRKNTFARFHANEGVEIFFLDLFAGAFLALGHFVTSSNNWVTLALMISTVTGLIFLMLSLITRVFLIIFSLAGKEARSPWFGKTQIIKVRG